jgi:hypothetical protein
MASGISKRQQATVDRITKVDASATHRVVEAFVFIEYVPRWERGRMTNGEYRENPNPQRVTHVISEDGRIHGWGFGPSVEKLNLPEGVKVTTKEDMAEALEARVESRKPAKAEAEPEATPEVEVEVEKPKAKITRKPAAKKPAAKRKTTGVQVVEN